MALVYDLVDPQELTGFVRGVQQELERNRFTLSQFLPNDNIDDIEWRMPKGTLTDEDAAVIRAWDVESPIGNRQGIQRIMGELPPISKKWRLGEEERLRQRKLLTGDAGPIIRAIYDDAAKGARAISARVELLRGEALEDAGLVINENGVVQTVSFSRTAAHNNAAAPVLWSTVATADPIKDLMGWRDVYLDTNGISPALVLVSTQTIGFLLQNDKIRALASSLSGAPSIVSSTTLQQVISAFGLPPLVTYDAKVRVNGSQVSVIDPKKIIMLPPANEPLGRTFFGTTAESLELVEAQQIGGADAPGMVTVVEKTTDPVATWTKTAAISLPVLANPNLTLVRTVLA
jgi:hypothetical protein